MSKRRSAKKTAESQNDFTTSETADTTSRRSGSGNTEVAIVGGGLAGGLTAYFMAQSHPARSITIIEAREKLGAGHIWGFHESDVSPAALEILKPLISRSWSSVSVEFPRVKKTLDGAYHAIRSEDFDRVLEQKFGENIKLKSRAMKLTDTTVVLEDGRVIEAPCVFDTRGLESLPTPGLNGFQKSISFDVTLAEPHGLTVPLLYDATCPQLDGLRYFTVLPWDQTRILVKETYFSDTPDLNEERITRSIRSYIERKGWKTKSVDRVENTVLPIPLTADAIKTSAAGEPVPLGLRAGFFHSTLGDSLPDATRFAEFLAKATTLTTASTRESLAKFRRSWISRQRFYRLMNRLIYQACESSLRYTILQKLFEHTDDVIQRFFAGRTTWTDRLRILSSKPPVPMSVTLKNFTERSTIDRQAALAAPKT